MMRIILLLFCLIQGIFMYSKSKKDYTISEKVIEFNLAKKTRGNNKEEVIRWIQNYRRNIAIIFIIFSLIFLIMIIFNNGLVIKVGF